MIDEWSKFIISKLLKKIKGINEKYKEDERNHWLQWNYGDGSSIYIYPVGFEWYKFPYFDLLIYQMSKYIS